MRIVIDMQGAQTGSRFRGIGRYTLSLVEALIKNKNNHEIILVLNNLQEESLSTIKQNFSQTLSYEKIKTYYVPEPVYEMDSNNIWRRLSAEKIREDYLLNLKPDFVLLTTFFEGFGEDFVCSISEFHNIPTAIIFYDLIPLMNKKEYLADPHVRTWYMNKVRQCEKAQLLLTISESAKQEAIEFLDIPNKHIINISTASDNRFRPINYTNTDIQILKEKFNIAKNYLMYSGATDDRKNHLRLIEAFSLLPSKLKNNFQLVFVGSIPHDHKTKFLNHAKKHTLSDTELIITGNVTDEEMNLLYNACTAFVFPSWHEGFGLPALEAMQCGKAVIASNTSSLPEVIGRDDALFDPFDVKDMSKKIHLVLSDEKFRFALEAHAKIQAKKFSWDITASKVLSSMEQYKHKPNSYTTNDSSQYTKLIKSIANISYSYTDNDLIQTSLSIYKNDLRPQLFIDISELAKHDSATGIQRVVKSCLNYILKNKLSHYTVHPVYLDTIGNYRSFSNYTNKKTISDDDEIVTFTSNDIYLCLDLLHPSLISNNMNIYMSMKKMGTLMVFLIYDILPIQFPKYANKGVQKGHISWLKNIIKVTDHFICISKTVKNDVQAWVKDNNLNNTNTIQYSWFHLGADITNSSPSKGLPSDTIETLNQIKSKYNFLMVGTIEPRKGHAQTLEAFETLWNEGEDINLVIVGKEGWLVDELVQKLRNHPELNKRLFLLEGISDEYLEKVYSSSSCLIAASEGEGFGLPLIEAAQKKIPIIARDIPVFREVAGEYAYYFENNKSTHLLADTIRNWIELYKENKHPKSDNMPWLTWEESAQQLLKCLNIEINSKKGK